MPRYYFHLWDGQDLRDEEGVFLLDAETAKARAFVYARDMAVGSVRDGYLTLSHYIRITGQGGEDVATVTFAEAVEVRP